MEEQTPRVRFLALQTFVHYAFALTALLHIAIGTLVAVLRPAHKPGFTTSRRRIHVAILVLILATYIGNAAIVPLQQNVFAEGEPRLLQLIVLILTWSWVTLRPSDPAYILCGTAIISTLFGALLLACSILDRLSPALAVVDIVLQCTRLLLLLIVVTSCLHTARAAPVDEHEHDNGEAAYRDDFGQESEQETLASNDEDDYDDDSDAEDVSSIKRRRAQRLQETGGWLAYLRDFSIFVPYLFPKGDRKVQFCFVISFFCIALSRVANVLIPRQLGIVTDRVLEGDPPYSALAILLLFNVLDEYRLSGLVQGLAKIPIKQFSKRGIANAAFSHVMTLSMDFHSDRDSAEVMKAIEQGTALSEILEAVALELVPVLCDVTLAMGLFWWKFNAYVALVVLMYGILMVSLEGLLLKKNIGNRRNMSKTEREQSEFMHQAVQGWQTVTYFNMFGFERRKYAGAVDSCLTARKKFETFDAITEFTLETTEACCFFLLASIVLYEVVNGRSTGGDFLFAVQYWQSLAWPIRFLSHNYKRIMTHLVDAERLLALLQTKPTVADREGAQELVYADGDVVFDKVSFCYDERKPTLKDLTLSASPGETVALVGATGAGKSTITKLLLRFYDVDSGSITIDGHDIRDVTLSSLRSQLGVVPQDPLLFNATILENLRYARPDATDEDIFAACRSAVIHDKIMGFADGYETKVGEQGVKLSGGEIQRLAIARVFLKNPPILILDEATSAIDTETEHKIQQALDVLKKGRTTFVVAHRLSTIVGADKIVVIDDGQIMESGTHSELIQMGGRYSLLWSRQAGGAIDG